MKMGEEHTGEESQADILSDVFRLFLLPFIVMHRRKREGLSPRHMNIRSSLEVISVQPQQVQKTSFPSSIVSVCKRRFTTTKAAIISEGSMRWLIRQTIQIYIKKKEKYMICRFRERFAS